MYSLYIIAIYTIFFGLIDFEIKLNSEFLRWFYEKNLTKVKMRRQTKYMGGLFLTKMWKYKFHALWVI